MEVVFRCVSVFVDKQHIHKLSVLSDGKGIKITNLVCTGKTGIGRHTQTHTTLDFHWSRSHFILCLSDIYLPITPLMLSCDFYPAMYFSVNILHLSAFPLIDNHSFNLVSSFWFLSPVRPHKIKVTLTSPARGEFCTKPHVQAHSDPSSREYATIYLLH